MLLFSLTILLVVVPLYPTFIKYYKTIAKAVFFSFIYLLFYCVSVLILLRLTENEINHRTLDLFRFAAEGLNWVLLMKITNSSGI